ncbi:MAG: DMT family transporter [Negativibacillus sp.]
MEKKRAEVMGSLSLLVVAIIWGSGFIASQMALDAQMSSAFIMFVRFAIAALIVGVVFHKDLKKNMKKEHIKGGLLIGTFLFLAFYVQTVALQYTTPSNNAFITAANVVIVPFLWWAISKKKPGAKFIVSSFLCLLGIGILSINFSEGFAFKIGDLMTLGCAFLFACQIVTTGILATKMDAKVIVFLQFAVAAVWGFFAFLLTDGDFSSFLSSEGMGAVIYLGVFSTCLCYFLQTTAQQHVHSAKAAIILSTESLFGTIFSVLLGYDPLSPQMVVGGIIILISITMTEIKLPFGKKEKPILVEKKED